jgi:glyceraldehyde 3-phosphate dehydrogenase
MTIRAAINGFGRIGRNVLRAIAESQRDDIEIVAINDLAGTEMLAHLLAFDSVHGRYPGTVAVNKDLLIVDGRSIPVFQLSSPAEIPWMDLGVEVVLECTGRFTKREAAAGHLEGGAQAVLISGPSPNADFTVVYGVNEVKLNNRHQVVSNASCTTNCLAPIAKIVHELAGIEGGFMTTIHSYTADQSLVDMPHRDFRRARAAALSQIPTSTGAAKALKLVIPELNNLVDGAAIRVPTSNVSMVDLVVRTRKTVTVEEVNDACRQAAETSLAGVLSFNELPLVSIDFNHDPASSIFDATQTKAMPGNILRVVAWYDNEWGFSNRVCDTAVYLARIGGTAE